jgi:hypothetical protein
MWDLPPRTETDRSEVSTICGDRSVKDLERELAEAQQQQAGTCALALSDHSVALPTTAMKSLRLT